MPRHLDTCPSCGRLGNGEPCAPIVGLTSTPQGSPALPTAGAHRAMPHSTLLYSPNALYEPGQC